MKSTIRTSPARLAALAVAAALAVPAVASGEPERRTVVAGTYKANGFHRFFLGSDYRDTWATPVSVEVLDLASEAGGLTPARRVGGQQTKGLALTGADGRSYTFRIVEFKEGGRSIIVSRRRHLEDEQKLRAAEVRASIVPDAVLQGRVASLQEFGAFVDLGGGIQGLLHVSDMSWARVANPGEVVAAITVPAGPMTRRSHYLKLRDRASFEFALVSAAVGLDMEGARIRAARVAVGGVGTKPWRLPQVEAALAGATLEPAPLRRAAAVAVQGARGRGHNDFKIALMQRAIVRAVETAGGRA